MFLANEFFGTSVGGLIDPEYVDQPLSWGKFVSVLEHLWIPVIVIGTSGTAAMIRRVRANLLDELRKPYVTTARAKGMPEFRGLMKYPFRMSLNFFIADIGGILPTVISGAEIVAIVLSLETTGPILIQALQSQDMYLAGSLQEAIYLAPQRRLIWWKFKRHKLAVASAIFLALMYLMTIFAEFIAPFVYDYDKTLDLENMVRVYTPNKEKIIKLEFFCSGHPYKFWGIIEADNHLMCADIDRPVFLLGSDTLGHDMLSRIVYGARISLTIGLVGVTISFACLRIGAR